jgi:hypothetical protein
VCDTPKKVADWLELEKDFKPMPDGLGWFYWHSKLNLYIEVVSWTKILRDAEMRISRQNRWFDDVPHDYVRPPPM